MKKPNVAVNGTVQFDFRANWKKIRKHLKTKAVVDALNRGLLEYVEHQNEFNVNSGSTYRLSWKPGDPPYTLGYDDCWIGKRIYKSSCDWYRPFGRCHWIAPFVLEIAKRLHPERAWFILSGPNHSVVTDRKRKIVFDILLFEMYSARQSLLHAGASPATPAEREFVELNEKHRQVLSEINDLIREPHSVDRLGKLRVDSRWIRDRLACLGSDFKAISEQS